MRIFRLTTVWLAVLLLVVGCADDDDSSESADQANDDDQTAADDDDDDDLTPEGAKRCNARDVPEEYRDGVWTELAACPRYTYCNFGECANTLIDLPTDESPHRDMIEWWYWTGNLEDAAGNRYGFELTYFYGARLFGIPAWMINTALIDLTAGTHTEDVWLDLHFPQENPTELLLSSRDATVYRGRDDRFLLRLPVDDAILEAELIDLKGPVHHGGNGSIRMSSRTTDSFYYSRPRLEVTGTLFRGETETPVTGQAWMDHQWGNFVPFILVGWDWFSVQFDDGTELMYFIFRSDEQDPTAIDMALGTYTDANGDQTLLLQADVTVTPLDQWIGPASGVVYPMDWRLTVTEPEIDIEVTAAFRDCEMPNIMWDYWEGPINVAGEKEGEPIGGRGFVELSGYAGRPLLWWLFDVWDRE